MGVFHQGKIRDGETNILKKWGGKNANGEGDRRIGKAQGTLVTQKEQRAWNYRM